MTISAVPVGVKERPGVAPFVGSDLPYLAAVPAGDEVSLFGGDDPHAGLLGDAPRSEVSDCFWSAEDREA